MSGVLLVVLGLALAGSQVPTLHPNFGVLGLGLLIAFAGGLIICDRPRASRRSGRARD